MNRGLDYNCECCGAPTSIVCATCIPYSTAFCYDCLDNHAQPRWVVDYIIEVSLENDIGRAAPWVFEITIFINGEYVKFKDYAERTKDAPA